ncbi:ATP-dependent DNA helicase RecG [uncultured Porphyromonas sp.]|uniref:ATP-dependent DNA helicase RecG n=1 Tax=uncultured Porphyromonas sp. TaxID=159274 RepID=UPI002606FD9D|nr:ATP-dependent DNA helicase RecG [uncultured Porphyromonas sp.]
MPQDFFHTPLTFLPSVGPRRAKVLAEELDLYTYLDLLHYFPTKYVDRSRVYTIRELRGEMPYVQLQGYIRDFKEVGEGRKKRLVGYFSDGTGTIELVWFRSLSAIRHLYAEGRMYIIFGKPVYFNGAYSITHPEIDDESKAEQVSGGLMPVYPLTEKLRRAGIASRQMRQLLYILKEACLPHIKETLPEEVIQRARLMSYAEAIDQIHFPQSKEGLEAARRRLKFDELFFIQLRLLSMKQERKTLVPGLPFPRVGEGVKGLYASLPFDLTGAQKRVIREIQSDLVGGKQMNRLIQGDVGSGKTLVALFSMLLALDNGYQACMMAPTEILARQHYASLREYLEPLGIEVGLLIGSTKKRERRVLLEGLSEGSLRLIVGTHALLESVVQFHHLGLAVIDEQHRFGVVQRSGLWQKGESYHPHILIMSATPIPRTLAMTLYGDLDISVIDELPPGRKPIETYHQSESHMYEVYQFLGAQIAEGRQAYVVFPMIEESEEASMRALEEGVRRYTEHFPELKIVHVHGKMKPEEKDEAMRSFSSGEAQLLLATTVIEVGVNVPNASVMVIEGANRFGLSQLHQLRGRVGRGASQSYCILVTGNELGEEAKRRIAIMVETNDGFEIAEEDMRLRGFGEIDGTRQSGQQLSLRIANPALDGAMVQYTRELAESILTEDPELSLPKNTLLRHRLQEIYYERPNWSQIS